MYQTKGYISPGKKIAASININALKADAFELLKKCDTLIASAPPKNDSLTGGALGLALYHYTAFSVFGKPQDTSRAEGLIHHVFNRLNNLEDSLLQTTYAQGLSGLGYTFNYLSNKKFIDFDIENEFVSVDEFLFNQAINQIRMNRNDFLHGAFGILFYFISRKKSDAIEQFVHQIIEEVHTNLFFQDETVFIRNEVIESMRDKINFGLSHGQAGFLLILLQAIEAGYDITLLSELAKKCIVFLLRQRQDADTKNMLSFFPVSIEKQSYQPDCNNRMAWCYGDLNQCFLLYRAAHVLKDNKYLEIADLVGLSSVMRIAPEATLCNDSHFCHGASGIAEMYKALYSLQPLPAYENAYYVWIQKTIEFLQPELGKGAYINKETELLDGLVGPALSLLSFVSNKKLDWQRFLLLP